MYRKLLLGIVLLFSCVVAQAATITKGYTFGTNETVTSTKLHSLVDSATISGISASDLSDGLVNNAKLGADSVTTDKIQDQTITANDIKLAGLTSIVYGTNSVFGFALNTNILFGSSVAGQTNTWCFTNIFTNVRFDGPSTTLSFTNGQIPPSAVSSVVTNLCTLLTSNRVSVASGSAYTWTSVAQLTTTATTGAVMVVGRAVMPVGFAGSGFIRVRDSTKSVSSGNNVTGIGGATATAISCSMLDMLTGSTKIYVLEIADSAGSQTWVANAATGVGGTGEHTNSLGLSVMQQF